MELGVLFWGVGGGGGGGWPYGFTAKLPQPGNRVRVGENIQVRTYSHRSHNYINTFFPTVPNFNMMKTLLVHAGLLVLFP